MCAQQNSPNMNLTADLWLSVYCQLQSRMLRAGLNHVDQKLGKKEETKLLKNPDFALGWIQSREEHSHNFGNSRRPHIQALVSVKSQTFAFLVESYSKSWRDR